MQLSSFVPALAGDHETKEAPLAVRGSGKYTSIEQKSSQEGPDIR
jgi:hypothetical protein